MKLIAKLFGCHKDDSMSVKVEIQESEQSKLNRYDLSVSKAVKLLNEQAVSKALATICHGEEVIQEYEHFMSVYHPDIFYMYIDFCRFKIPNKFYNICLERYPNLTITEYKSDYCVEKPSINYCTLVEKLAEQLEND